MLKAEDNYQRFITPCRGAMDLSNKHFTGKMNCVHMVFEEIQKTPSIMMLNLRNTGISSDGIKNVAFYLQECLQIHEIDLSHNTNFTPTHMRSAIRMIKLAPSLRVINLSENIFPPDVFSTFRKIMTTNQTILTIDLSGCGLVDQGFSYAVKEILLKNTTLRVMTFDNNKFTAAGVCTINEGMLGNTTLRTLSLLKNAFDSESDPSYRSILQLCENNRSGQARDSESDRSADTACALYTQMQVTDELTKIAEEFLVVQRQYDVLLRSARLVREDFTLTTECIAKIRKRIGYLLQQSCCSEEIKTTLGGYSVICDNWDDFKNNLFQQMKL